MGTTGPVVDLIDTPARVGPPVLSAVSTSFPTGARRVRFATAVMLVAEASACVGLGCALRLVDDSSSLGVIAVAAMVALVVVRAGMGAVAGAGFVGPALLGALRAGVLVVALFG